MAFNTRLCISSVSNVTNTLEAGYGWSAHVSISSSMAWILSYNSFGPGEQHKSLEKKLGLEQFETVFSKSSEQNGMCNGKLFSSWSRSLRLATNFATKSSLSKATVHTVT
jgi:hypothetical protein